MAEGERLSQEAFLSQAAAAGIDVSGTHGEELLAFVRNILASLESLKKLDVSAAEPDMAFVPQRE
jgi:Asp-tRNA(Asn)/Glu-tRNA(Gln) amidotransferase C subunit